MTEEAQRESASGEKRYWLKLSNVCNNHCLFCLDEDSRRTTPFESLDRLAEEIRQAAARGACRLVVSGGEPTIHPEFTGILALGHRAGFKKIQVITNGRMFSYRSFAREAIRAGLTEATFSIHGHTPELHDRLTGVKGSFRQALMGITNIRASGRCIISIDIVVNRLNYRHVPDIMRYFMAQGIHEFDLLNLIPFGAARRNWRQLSFSCTDALPFMRQAFALNGDRRCFVWTNRFPAPLLEDFEELIQPPEKLYDEVLGRIDSFEMYRDRGHFYCEGEICDSCFIHDFCRHFRFYCNPGKPGTVITAAAGEPLTKFLSRCQCLPERLRMDLTADNYQYIRQQDGVEQHWLPGSVIFTVNNNEACKLAAGLTFPSSPHCYLEFPLLPPSFFSLPLHRNGAGIIIVLNSAAQDFLLANRAAFAGLAGLLNFRIPVYEHLTEARREYSQLPAVLACYPDVPVFGATPCLCRHSSPAAGPVLDLRLSAGSSREQLTALVKDFILHRYCIKSLRCSQCPADGTCPGMPVNFVRCFGFKSLKPLAAPVAAGAVHG